MPTPCTNLDDRFFGRKIKNYLHVKFFVWKKQKTFFETHCSAHEENLQNVSCWWMEKFCLFLMSAVLNHKLPTKSCTLAAFVGCTTKKKELFTTEWSSLLRETFPTSPSRFLSVWGISNGKLHTIIIIKLCTQKTQNMLHTLSVWWKSFSLFFYEKISLTRKSEHFFVD